MKYDVLVFSDSEKTKVKIMPEKLTSSDTLLRFFVQDPEDKTALETLCKDAEATKIITYGQYNDETLELTEIKKYSQYTALEYLGTKYQQLVSINYDEEDESTESGFQEIRADITEVNLGKKSYLQRQLDALKAGGGSGSEEATQAAKEAAESAKTAQGEATKAAESAAAAAESAKSAQNDIKSIQDALIGEVEETK